MRIIYIALLLLMVNLSSSMVGYSGAFPCDITNQIIGATPDCPISGYAVGEGGELNLTEKMIETTEAIDDRPTTTSLLDIAAGLTWGVGLFIHLVATTPVAVAHLFAVAIPGTSDVETFFTLALSTAMGVIYLLALIAIVRRGSTTED